MFKFKHDKQFSHNSNSSDGLETDVRVSQVSQQHVIPIFDVSNQQRQMAVYNTQTQPIKVEMIDDSNAD
jgi:hypothetical protein